MIDKQITDHLCDAYIAFVGDALPDCSADELQDATMTEAERDFRRAFLTLWAAASQVERERWVKQQEDDPCC